MRQEGSGSRIHRAQPALSGLDSTWRRRRDRTFRGSFCACSGEAVEPADALSGQRRAAAPVHRCDVFARRCMSSRTHGEVDHQVCRWS